MIGTQILHYRLERKLGEGGMGEVFLATDTKLDRKVALKFLPDSIARDSDARARLIREAKAASKLNHPNILTIHAVEQADEQLFIVMEYVKGQTLSEYFQSGERTMAEIIDLATQIGEGLKKAHEAGVTHRDLKPANILVDADGRARLVDFGLAKLEGVSRLTKTGSTLGTLGYSSPEQVEGKGADHRSDIFSVGVVLHELIAGQLPFQGSYEAELLYAILQADPEPLANHRTDVPDNLQNIVSKCLSKNPDERYQSAEELLTDLRVSTVAGAVPKVRRRSPNRARVIFLASAAVVVAVLALVFRPWLGGDESNMIDNRLAVMYFGNLADPEDPRKLGEIISSLLITDLDQSQYVDVVSSQRLYDILKLLGREGLKTIEPSVATEVATKARARWMLQGKVLQESPQLVISAELVDVTTGDLLASSQVTGQLGEGPFTLVDELTTGIKNNLALPAGALDEADPPVIELTTASEDAYRHYLEGNEHRSQWRITEAIESYQKAIEADSTFAMAYYGLALFTVGADAQAVIGSAIRHMDGASRREQQYILARRAHVELQLDSAVTLYEQIAADYPEDKEPLLWMGYTLLWDLSNYEQATQAFLRMVEIDPLDKVAWAFLVDCYDYLGDFEKAISASNKYIEVAPDEPGSYTGRAQLYTRNAKLEEAITSIKMALEIDSAFVFGRVYLAELYMLTGEYGLAESLFQGLVGDPDPTARALGRRRQPWPLLHQGRFQEALNLLEENAKADSAEWGVTRFVIDKRFARGYVYEMYLQDLDRALAEYEVARDMAVQTANARLLLFGGAMARVQAKKGNLNMAAVMLQEVDSLPMGQKLPSFVWEVHGQYGLATGEFDTAVVYFERLEAKNPRAFEYKHLLAKAHFGAGRLGDAVTLFEEALTLYDLDGLHPIGARVLLHYDLGLAYEASGWDDKAIEQYETFLDIWKNADPGLKSVDDARARLARLRG